MTCRNTARFERIITQIQTLQAQLEALNLTFLTASATDVDEYRFNSNEGSQSTGRRSLTEMGAAIDRLQAMIDKLYRQLEGNGITIMNLRRKQNGPRC